MIDYLDISPNLFLQTFLIKIWLFEALQPEKPFELHFKQLFSYYFVYGVLFSKANLYQNSHDDHSWFEWSYLFNICINLNECVNLI